MTDGVHSLGSFAVPSPESRTTQGDMYSNTASDFCRRLVEMMMEFDQQLDHHHTVSIRLVSFGQAVQFQVTRLGFYDPYLIRFFGVREDGAPIELIQHVSQINFLLMAVRRPDPTIPKAPIGFEIHSLAPQVPAK